LTSFFSVSLILSLRLSSLMSISIPLNRTKISMLMSGSVRIPEVEHVIDRNSTISPSLCYCAGQVTGCVYLLPLTLGGNLGYWGALEQSLSYWLGSVMSSPEPQPLTDFFEFIGIFKTTSLKPIIFFCGGGALHTLGDFSPRGCPE